MQKLPPIILGGNPFGWTIGATASHRVLDAAIAAGLTAIDTADVYARFIPGKQGGESESVIGTWLAERGRRDDVFIATKVGMDMGEGSGLSANWITTSVEGSLRRLRTDYIDLYQAHRDDPATPLAETLGAFSKLIEQGKIRAIGASNYSAKRLAEALETSKRLGLPRFETLQPWYNLLERTEFETELGPFCIAEGLGTIPYFALASGFLTGKYRNAADLAKSQRGGRMGKYMGPRGMAVLAALDEVAASHLATLGQVAIAWLISRPGVTAPIASVTSPAQLDELVQATRLVLSASDVAQLDAASA